MQNLSVMDSKPSFTSVSRNTKTAEELEREADEMKSQAAALRFQENERIQDEANQQKEKDLKILQMLRIDLRELDENLKLSGRMTLQEVTEVNKTRKQILDDISGLEIKLGLNSVNADPESESTIKSVWPTVAKILALIIGCFGIVLYSGDFILDKYPNAATYNEVSFQKILFGFAVFIAAIGSAMIALSFVLPVISKYFSPFNRNNLDFSNDFQNLSPWQRTLISAVFFVAFLFAFVLTVSGKLD